MKISVVHDSSPAARLGLLPGDELLRIDNHEIRDPIDFQFYSAEEEYSLVLRRGTREWRVEVSPEESGWLGLEFANMEYRCCGNRCVFCFVDQNPSGLRDALYFKDEDFRLSFLYGNYVTLTNVTGDHLARIVEQRLSPLYISVHSTEDDVRRKMLGLRGNDRLMEKIALLAEGGIELHAQIVLCPGWNDGLHLERTLTDLARFSPAVRSVAIVPLGLTGHRVGLTPLQPVTPADAAAVLDQEKAWERRFRAKQGSAFVYLADEFYLLSGRPLPRAARYDDFFQIENGVGMTRHFLDRFQRQRGRFPKAVRPVRVVIATGQLVAPTLAREVLPVLRKVAGLEVDLVPVVNRFFGGGVTVSGLLTGRDILEQVRDRMPADLLLIPPNCRNADGLFLDDWDGGQLSRELDVPLFAPAENFSELFAYLKKS
ncbi:MAG TPA: DUF512 domain-containing protein [bacterium]|nr:DUF512 domain-containing protein [bacterium]HQG45283.1 DUF512 domain-containing protein [bacterium]HQI49512.1 DUF512 domain-containing protein [bacterium]HQJ64825.1 DUF512 domain-containing protein [bacterium]